MSALRCAFRELNDRLADAEAIGEALDLAADVDHPPAWVYVFRQQIRLIQQAAEAAELAMNQGVQP